MQTKSEVICKECEGRRYVVRGNSYVSCTCKLKKEIKEYLGHFYKDAKYRKETTLGHLLKSNLHLDNGDWETFRSIVKTALLNECMKCKHITATPHDIICAYMDNESARYSLIELRGCDLLVLYINMDPDNKQYDKYLVNLLEDRRLSEKVSWIFSSIKFSSEDFEKKYGNLGSYLIKKFNKINLGN